MLKTELFLSLVTLLYTNHIFPLFADRKLRFRKAESCLKLQEQLVDSCTRLLPLCSISRLSLDSSDSHRNVESFTAEIGLIPLIVMYAKRSQTKSKTSLISSKLMSIASGPTVLAEDWQIVTSSFTD